jgi:hypothetical protein
VSEGDYVLRHGTKGVRFNRIRVIDAPSVSRSLPAIGPGDTERLSMAGTGCWMLIHSAKSFVPPAVSSKSRNVECAKEFVGEFFVKFRGGSTNKIDFTCVASEQKIS